MARFETEDGKWLETRYERNVHFVRASGDHGRRIVCPDADYARRWYIELVEEKLAEGYRWVPPDDEPVNPELEAALLARPDDVEAWAVYGDWLAERGHPRGELSALQRGKLTKAAHELLETHRDKLIGPLVCLDEGIRGGIAWGPYGFIRSATVVAPCESKQGDDVSPRLLEVLLSHPSARFLDSLALALAPRFDRTQYQRLVLTLGEVGARALRTLYLGGRGDGDEFWSDADLGDLSSLWEALPRLETLVVTARFSALGPIESLALRRAEFRRRRPDLACLRQIVQAHWPCLEHLDVWLGTANASGLPYAELETLLSATRVPKLRHLGLLGAGETEALIGVLAESPLLPRLETLDLSDGTFTDAGVERLLRVRSRFAHLRAITLGNRGLSADMRARLEAVLPVRG